MALFNFFLVLSGLALTGLAYSLHEGGGLGIVAAVLGLLTSIVAFVFWKLDQRVSFLMKRAEEAIIETERYFHLPCARVFTVEERLTAKIRKGNPWRRYWTYGECFRLVFLIVGAGGCLATAFAIWQGAALVD